MELIIVIVLVLFFIIVLIYSLLTYSTNRPSNIGKVYLGYITFCLFFIGIIPLIYILYKSKPSDLLERKMYLDLETSDQKSEITEEDKIKKQIGDIAKRSDKLLTYIREFMFFIDKKIKLFSELEEKSNLDVSGTGYKTYLVIKKLNVDIEKNSNFLNNECVKIKQEISGVKDILIRKLNDFKKSEDKFNNCKNILENLRERKETPQTDETEIAKLQGEIEEGQTNFNVLKEQTNEKFKEWKKFEDEYTKLIQLEKDINASLESNKYKKEEFDIVRDITYVSSYKRIMRFYVEKILDYESSKPEDKETFKSIFDSGNNEIHKILNVNNSNPAPKYNTLMDSLAGLKHNLSMLSNKYKSLVDNISKKFTNLPDQLKHLKTSENNIDSTEIIGFYKTLVVLNPLTGTEINNKRKLIVKLKKISKHTKEKIDAIYKKITETDPDKTFKDLKIKVEESAKSFNDYFYAMYTKSSPKLICNISKKFVESLVKSCAEACKYASSCLLRAFLDANNNGFDFRSSKINLYHYIYYCGIISKLSFITIGSALENFYIEDLVTEENYKTKVTNLAVKYFNCKNIESINCGMKSAEIAYKIVNKTIDDKKIACEAAILAAKLCIADSFSHISSDNITKASAAIAVYNTLAFYCYTEKPLLYKTILEKSFEAINLKDSSGNAIKNYITFPLAIAAYNAAYNYSIIVHSDGISSPKSVSIASYCGFNNFFKAIETPYIFAENNSKGYPTEMIDNLDNSYDTMIDSIKFESIDTEIIYFPPSKERMLSKKIKSSTKEYSNSIFSDRTTELQFDNTEPADFNPVITPRSILKLFYFYISFSKDTKNGN